MNILCRLFGHKWHIRQRWIPNIRHPRACLVQSCICLRCDANEIEVFDPSGALAIHTQANATPLRFDRARTPSG